FVGFRYEIGVDWNTYLMFYDTLKWYSLKDSVLFTDPMFGALNYWGNQLGFKDTLFVNSVCAFILFYFFYFFSKKFKFKYVPLLVGYTYFIVVVSMNYVRQSVAVSISLLAMYYALTEKKYSFLLLIFLATLFHKSAIILLVFFPLCFFSKIDLNKILNFFYIIFSLFFITFILYFSGSQGGNIYTDSDSEISSSGTLFRLFSHLVPMILYIRNRNEFKHNLKGNIVMLDYMFILILYCFLLSFFYSTLADRFNLYLFFFDVYVYSFVCDRIDLRSRILLLVFIFIFYTSNFFVWFNFGTYALKGWIPYQNYIINFLSNTL
ncbi:TPA: EpsG family protein, partial [Acinetobacter baumannii]